MIPRVIDLSHHNTVRGNSLKLAADSGIWALIHKATEGTTVIDQTYRTRRAMARDAGLMVGAYHFNRGNDYRGQAKHFIDTADPDASTLLVLDYESTQSNMSIQAALAFMREAEEQCGKQCAIYSGERLKSTISELSGDDLKYILSKRLWLCQYGPRAVLPKGFDKYFLWQYAADGYGLQPHHVPGFETENIDLSVFDGSLEELQNLWAD